MEQTTTVPPAALQGLSRTARHVFGMAKSSLDLRGAKSQKLELDLLRLGYVVQTLRQHGLDAQGYLLVVVPALVPTVEGWMAKYALGTAVQCLCAELDPMDLERLHAEKRQNVAGMVAGAQREPVAGRSSAALGQRLGEDALLRRVMEREPGLLVRSAMRDQPFAVQWDLYGLRTSVAPHTEEAER